MRSHFCRVFTTIGFTSLLALATGSVAQGQQKCSNTTLHGSYGLHATGITGVGGNFAAVGRFTFDGKGNLTGIVFVRVAGNDVEVHVTGTYSVSAECIVDDVWNTPGGASTHKSVIVNQGRGYFILNNTSGDGSAISGEAKKQSFEDED